jgi:antirestriction protein ArdC
MSTTTKTTAPASWRALLEEAITEPGKHSEAYRAFHNYSIGNQLLALTQCAQRDLPVGPIATYKGWQAKGRQVRKGERALTLCMPVTIKKEREGQDEPDMFQVFTYKRRWFVLA